MIKTIFSKTSRLAQTIEVNRPELMTIYENDYLIFDGSFSEHYLLNGIPTPKTEAPLYELIGNTIDFGVRKVGDSVRINNETHELLEEERLEVILDEQGEYEIHISFLEYLDKTFTVTIT
jgi:hypothetical protein